MPTQDRNHAETVFLARVMAALDEAARECFGADTGATAADVPYLAADVSRHLDRLKEREGYLLTENWVGSDLYKAQQRKRQMQGLEPLIDDALAPDAGVA